MIDKWYELIKECVELCWFYLFDFVSYTVEKIWVTFISVLCIPIALLGLMLDNLKKLLRMVSHESLLKLAVVSEDKLQREGKNWQDAQKEKSASNCA